MADPDFAAIESVQETADLRRQIVAVQRRLESAKAKTVDLVAAVHQAARDAAVLLGNPPPVPKPKQDRRRRPEMAILHLSDLHFGKQTPSFNSEIAAKRLQLLAGKVERFTEIERADHPVREARLLLGGDLVENLGIFPGQVYEVDSSMFTQVFAAVHALEGLCRHMLGLFERVRVYEVFGNHGRIGRKGDNPRGDNIDRLIGAILRDRLKVFEVEGRLSWREPHGWYNIVEAGAYRALLIHGDQVKSFGGNTPAFGITRKVNAWATGVLPPFTDCYMGQFHQPLVLPMANGRGRTFVNPSIESDSEYAQEFVAATGTPGQRLHFVDPLRGRITTERVVWLDD